MANLKDLIVNGSARVLGTLYADVSGTATTATKLGTATVGSTITPIYLNGGTPTALGYTIAKSVPADANFSNTTYSAGTDLSLSGTTFNHKASGVTAGTAGTSTATSGSTLSVPYVTYNAQGHVTAAGTHTHTVTGFVPTSRTVNGKTLSANISLTYSDVSAASSGHTHDGYVPSTRSVNGKTLSADISLTYSDVSAASSGHTHSGYQSTSTAVTHTANTAVGSTIKPVYVASGGAATALSANIGNTITPMYMASGELKALSYTIAKSVPANANFSNTTYSSGTGLSLSGTTFNHASSITAGTVGTSTASSGSTLTVPYVTYNASGHITATGTRTHTVTGFLTAHQTIKNHGVTGATINTYASCATAAATAAKEASITTGTFNLETGAKVYVKFTNANTAGTPTLNINSKGAKNIFHKGAQITTGSNKSLLAGICEFMYDGTQWHLVGNYIDTVYSHPTTSGNKHIPSGGSSGQFLKWSADGTATWAADNNTTYSAGTGLSLSGTTFNHASSITAGTVGTSKASSGSTLTVPYVTYNASGHITATGTRTHTVTGFVTSSTAVTHTANTAVGSTLQPVYIASNGTATAITGIKVGMLAG